jgi:hypothetical protein
MLKQTPYSVSKALLDIAANTPLLSDFKNTINAPTGKFFYDKWELLPVYKGTVWEEIMNTLPVDCGEARLIRLGPGTCYNSHADIDDRYHLNITGNYCYLVNIDTASMYKLIKDGIWYDFNAGPRHSAVNFGDVPRTQLVIRKLLKNNTLQDPVNVSIIVENMPLSNARYIFDDTVSLWLNHAVKQGILTGFDYSNNGTVCFTVERSHLHEVATILPKGFILNHD